MRDKFQNLAIELSWDHKPTRPDEKERIRKKGGKIERLLDKNKQPVGPYRIWEDEEGPGITMTRSMGDFASKRIGLISTPEISHIELTKDDIFTIIASDGVWDIMNSAEACGYVRKQLNMMKANPGLKIDLGASLCQICREKWDALNQAKHEAK